MIDSSKITELKSLLAVVSAAGGAWLLLRTSPTPTAWLLCAARRTRSMAQKRTTCAPPPVLLTGPVLGGLIAAQLSVTTFLYLNHDRENKEWKAASGDHQGWWPAPTSDFDWCEPNYLYTPMIAEVWNTVTSLFFCIGPMLLWPATRDWSMRLNLLLLVAIGLGSAAFHATLQYESQLLDELPMIMYIAHTVAMLKSRDVRCPRWVWAAGFALSALLFSTPRENPAHKAGRAVMVLGFSGCFCWLGFSFAPLSAQLDQSTGGSSNYKYTRRYQQTSLAVLLAIAFWVTDNMACKELHSLPAGLPYPQLHALVWHTGMAFTTTTLSHAVLGKRQQRTRALASAQSE